MADTGIMHGKCRQKATRETVVLKVKVGRKKKRRKIKRTGHEDSTRRTRGEEKRKKKKSSWETLTR